MLKSLLKKYSRRDLLMIKVSLKNTRDKTQQIIDRLTKKLPGPVSNFKKKAGISDLEKNIRWLNRSISRIDELI